MVVNWITNNVLLIVGLISLIVAVLVSVKGYQISFSDDRDDVDDPPRDGNQSEVATSQEAEFEQVGTEVEDGVLELPRPTVSNSSFGILGQLWKMRQHYRKEEKLLSRGYVKWFVIDDTWPEPKYVKPEAYGDGVWKVEHDGDPYLFPKGALIPDSRQGIRTVIHKRGEADPINLREPSDVSIPTDVLDEYLTMAVTSSPPSFWDKLGWDTQDLVRLSVGAAIAFAVVWGVLGGGL